MTTDNRTNEPNKYAGFIARQNHQRDPWRGIGKKCLCGVVFDSDVDHAMHQVEAILEAALVAAAGVAPHAESDRALEIAHELAKVHTFTLADGEAIARAALSLAAPVQPSSTVDEGKIAEVVRGLRFNDAGCWAGGIDCTESVSDHADVIARAVVEAIGGQSR